MSEYTNGDMPAHPQPLLETSDGVKWSTHELDDQGGGLTKREYFAALAMQGLFADPNTPGRSGIPFTAVRAADALITALEKSEDT